ncbi:MAG: NAD-dependent epimerase/dehydratase family protein [Candidatus Sumerlaeota bacterium]|nr:NAD-dependent epimerase/dehydratase family protein [Candidatus Sumerlaeota bacterium]
MKILVTGAAGFIGSHLSERLADLGHAVIGLDCFTDYYARSLKELNAAEVRKKGVPILELDLAEDDLAEAVSGAEIVYHLAGQPGISSTTPFDIYLKNNIVATARLVEAVYRLSTLKCFVNIATSSIYGLFATDSEEAPPKPTSHYGVTKLAAEQTALSYWRDKRMPACSLRIFSVYGERERPEKLYPKLIQCILDDQPFPLFEGSEKHSRSFTYVGDVVDGMVAVLARMEACRGEIINIGSDIEITTGDGIRIVEKILGRKARLAIQPKRSGDQLRTRASIDKARRLLGYSPKTRPEDGLRAEVEWFAKRVYGKS